MQQVALRILRDIGIEANEECLPKESFVTGQVETLPVDVHGTKVSAEVTLYQDGSSRVEVHFELPENACMADTFIEHCVNKENIPTGGWNHNPYAGRKTTAPLQKHTEAYSPWHNRFFCIDSMYYGKDEFDEAVENTITLAKPFVRCLPDVPTLLYWKTTDKEVVEKAREVIENAALQETDCDPEEKAHWLVDRNSFIKGWFYPFNDRGKGTFDTVWPSSLDYAAKCMGHEGTFKYAVACIVLEDPEYIRKAREACRIREEKIIRRY